MTSIVLPSCTHVSSCQVIPGNAQRRTQDGEPHSPAGWCFSLDINARNLQRRGAFPSRPATRPAEPSPSHLSSETFSCFLFTFRDLFSSAAPHGKTHLPGMFLDLLAHVAEAAIFWQRWHTGSWPCVCGYVTADEAIIWRGVKKINRTLYYKGNRENAPCVVFSCLRNVHSLDLPDWCVR